MCPTLISASAILPKKNPHPHSEPAAVHAANPNTFLFPGFRLNSATILPLSHTREWKKIAALQPLESAGASYQTRQLFTGTIGDPFLHPNAAANPGWFTIAPFARK